MYYSFSEAGFFSHDAHGELIPADSVSLTNDEYLELNNAKSIGKSIVKGDDGKPVAVFLEMTPSLNKPEACTPAQGLVALFAIKQITEDDVQAAIDSITDPVQKYTAQIAFKRAVTWDRNSQTMQNMAQLLALSEKDLDELFEYAVTIQA